MANNDRYGRYANIPIPTYDEAISSRPGSSTQHQRGPGEISDDAERQGLLFQQGDGSGSHYRPPTVDSPRLSEDSDLGLPEVGGGDDAARRHIEELDYLDPEIDLSRRSPRPYHRTRIRNISSRFSKLSATLSSIRLPSFRSLYSPVASDSDAAPQPSPSQRTSLFQRFRDGLPTIPEPYRLSYPTIARLVGLATLIGIFYLLFTTEVFSAGRFHNAGRYDPETVRSFVQENVDSERIAEYLTHITSYDHVAGTEGGLYMAEWMRERWKAEGGFDDTALMSYYVYLNYPVQAGRSVMELAEEGGAPDGGGGGVAWQAELEEGMIDMGKQQTLAWLGHSKSGEARGHLVFANNGDRADFDLLRSAGVVLQGCIALMRVGGAGAAAHGQKIRAAEEAGCVAALLFTDPRDDGSARGQTWPEGPWRPEDSVQRAGVAMTNWVVGDPLTPGHASVPDAKRISRESQHALSSIPALPLSWRDAGDLISRLFEKGARVPEDWAGGDPNRLPKDWHGGAKEWYSGNASQVVLDLQNSNDENEKQQIWNLHGVHKGVEQADKRIIVGSHHDAWCFGALPGSGSAVMMELVAIFGQLRKVGWKPLRTIEFASWDATEINLMGSTEHVEENIDRFRGGGVAYINVDVGVSGPDALFRAAASPLWQRPLLHALGRVSDPGSDKSLRETWETRNAVLGGLGAHGDYVAFQHMAGISSIDLGFGEAQSAAVKGSCYDTFQYMEKLDPGFNYHRALAQVWALLILEVADQPLLPLDLRAYAIAVKNEYMHDLEAFVEEQKHKPGQQTSDPRLDLTPLYTVADAFMLKADQFHAFEDDWTRLVYSNNGIESRQLGNLRIKFNNALADFERDLLDLPTNKNDRSQHGAEGREQYKHVVLGPTSQSEDVGYFPFVRDAILKGDWAQAQEMVAKTAAIMQKAVDNLPVPDRVL